MLIRVRPDLFINTDTVSTVYFPSSGTVRNSTPTASICADGQEYEVSQEAARFVCEMMEANSAAILPEDEDSEPGKPTLKTQIAQALRDTWKGATLGQLDAVFPDAGVVAISAALAELATERTVIDIVKTLADDSMLRLYYHASSSEAQAYAKSEIRNPKSEILPTPSLDLSTAAAAQPDALHQVEEHSES